MTPAESLSRAFDVTAYTAAGIVILLAIVLVVVHYLRHRQDSKPRRVTFATFFRGWGES